MHVCFCNVNKLYDSGPKCVNSISLAFVCLSRCPRVTLLTYDLQYICGVCQNMHICFCDGLFKVVNIFLVTNV